MVDIDSCYDCDGINLSYRYIYTEEDRLYYEVTCRECGTSWEDYEEE